MHEHGNQDMGVGRVGGPTIDPKLHLFASVFSWVNGDERLELRNQHVCNFCMLLPEFISANLGTRARWGVLEAVPHLPRKSVGILEAPGSEGTSRTWRLWWPRVPQESGEVPGSFFGAELWAPIFHIAFKKWDNLGASQMIITVSQCFQAIWKFKQEIT